MWDGTQFSDPEIKNTLRTGNFHLYILFPVTRKKSSIVPKLKKATTNETEEAPDTTIQSEDATNIHDNFKGYPMSLT